MTSNDPVTCDLFPSVTYVDASAAIDWLERAFGFRRRLVVPGPDDSVVHSELTFGNGIVMVGSEKPSQDREGLRGRTTTSHAIAAYVADPDAHFATAKAAGAEIVRELQDEEYGGRGYMARDPEGHTWYFGSYRPGAYWSEG